jgi:hypothetical protein
MSEHDKDEAQSMLEMLDRVLVSDDPSVKQALGHLMTITAMTMRDGPVRIGPLTQLVSKVQQMEHQMNGMERKYNEMTYRMNDIMERMRRNSNDPSWRSDAHAGTALSGSTFQIGAIGANGPSDTYWTSSAAIINNPTTYPYSTDSSLSITDLKPLDAESLKILLGNMPKSSSNSETQDR